MLHSPHMRMNRFIVPATLAALLLAGAGCITINGGGAASTQGSDGGIFKTANKGDAWVQSVAVPSTDGTKRAIAGVNVSNILQDPTDPRAFYIGTPENGLFYSYDSGASWEQSPQMARGRVSAISVNAKDKCTVYAAKDNTVVMTTDCSRTWSVIYIDNRQNAVMTSVVDDFYDPRVVWTSTLSGDLLKSTDGGTSWAGIRSFGGPILRVALHPSDSRIVYVVTKTNGIWRSRDAGVTWVDLSENYKEFSGARDFLDLAFGGKDPNLMVMANKYGLLRSTDAGDTWKKIELLTPPGNTVIYSVAIDPRNSDNLYYGTSTTFYRSSNGGTNWVPKKLPTGRTATTLLVDRADPNVLYMGVTRFK